MKEPEGRFWIGVHVREGFGDETPDHRSQGQKQDMGPKEQVTTVCLQNYRWASDPQTPCSQPRLTALVSALRQKPKECCTHQRNELSASSASKVRIHTPEQTLSQAHGRRVPTQQPKVKLPGDLLCPHLDRARSSPCSMGRTGVKENMPSTAMNQLVPQ